MSLPDRVNIAAGVVTRRLGDELVLLDLASGTYFGLNLVGARVWELLKSGCTPPEVLGHLVGEFDVDAKTLEQDLGELLNNLAANSLISTG